MVDEYVIVYGGIEGELKQNSYGDFAADNQFVSPTLNILPTDRQYDGYVGLKGKLQNNIGYNIRGSYIAENNKPFYRLNAINNDADANEGYSYGNSFDVVYDDVKTISVFGELNIDVNRNFSLGINAEVFDYDMGNEQEPWNLPSLKGSLFADFQISDQWYMGANLFYVGERDELFSNANNPLSNPEIRTLDSYFDANAHLGYHFNEQLSAFLKFNNLANNNYARWANYNVMGFQVMAGATYKFDWN